jgi:hypothetical protein
MNIKYDEIRFFDILKTRNKGFIKNVHCSGIQYVYNKYGFQTDFQ